MKNNLDYYVFKKKILSDKFCDETIKQLNKNKNWKKHTFYNNKTKKHRKFSGKKELDISFEENIDNKKEIMNSIWYAIEEYLLKHLKFKWFNSWVGYSNIRFNKYSTNTKMAEHCDHIHDLFEGPIKGVPIFSIVGLLNDNFKGGDFIMFQNKKIKLSKGEILIFPSNFLYPHRVDLIKKVTRHSYVSWVW